MAEHTVYIVRHAKSSWANFGQQDFDRPLNDRGETDAPKMGARLKALGVKPDIICASSAKRTRETSKLLAKELGYDKKDIQFIDRLYQASPDTMETVISSWEEEIKTGMLIAHNPGVTTFVNSMNESFRTDNMPTCSVVGIRFNGNWNEFPQAEKEILFFEYPKKTS